MRVLIIGGNGFIGSHLADALTDRGCRIRSLDRAAEHYRGPLSNVEYVYGDFCDAGLISDALDGIDAVFHLASTTVPGTSNRDPVFDVQSNVLGTLAMLDACVRKRVGRVVYVSSGGAVYGIPEIAPVPEESRTEPISSYGITKLCIEKYLHLYRHLHGLDYVVVRPSNPYGPRQNPSGVQGAVGVFLGRLAMGLPITIWGDGSVVRDYIHVRDLVSGICAAAFGSPAGQIFNLGSGEGTSLCGLLSIIEEVVRQPVAIEYLPARAFDVPEIYLDIGRARNELGWRPAIRLQEGIEETWNFVSKWAGSELSTGSASPVKIKR